MLGVPTCWPTFAQRVAETSLVVARVQTLLRPIKWWAKHIDVARRSNIDVPTNVVHEGNNGAFSRGLTKNA